MRYLFSNFLIMMSHFCFSQQQIRIDQMKGGEVNMNKSVTFKNQVFTRTTINKYNRSEKDAILNVEKYLDTLKQIRFDFGGQASWYIKRRFLSDDYDVKPFHPSKSDSNFSFLSLKIVDGKLKLSLTINSFDGKYIARVVNNKLIPSKKDYHLYVSDRYFELFDDYYIPVLQIELVKKGNTISIGGAFNYDDGYTIISKNEFKFVNFNPKLSMTQRQRDSLFQIFLNDARTIKPIHE